MDVDRRALELCERVVDERQAERTQRERHAVELVVDLRGGEPARHGLLLEPQDVDGEHLAPDQRGVALRLVVHAYQDERWLERHRRERARGEPRRATVLIADSDDGDARGEMAEDTTEFVWRNHPLFVAGRRRERKVSRIDR